jgi:hypothetical protein
MLSHDWGEDEFGRSNHRRVLAISRALQEKGLKTWIDEEQMEGNVVDQMCRAIDDAMVVLVFVTQRYAAKVGGLNHMDNCKKEFNYAASRKGAGAMLAVVMEERMRNTGLWGEC